MGKVGISNISHSSPKWLVNLTGASAILTPIIPTLIQSMPGSVSADTKEWILWSMSVITAILGMITMLSKSNKTSVK